MSSRVPPPLQAGCLTDPTSVRGLRQLARSTPGWDARVRSTRRSDFGLSPDATVPQLLCSGVVERLWPRSPKDVHRVYADRGSANRLALLFPDVRAKEVEEKLLRALIDGDVDGAPGPKTRSRDAGLLRDAVRTFHASVGTESPVLPRARPAPGRKTPPPLSPRPEAILSALANSDPDARLLIGIALGLGATPTELGALRRVDLVLLRGVRPYFLLGTRDRKRAAPLPAWLFSLVKEAGDWNWWRRHAEPVFGRDANPDRLGRQLAAACRRSGLERRDVTLRRLRATWQALVERENPLRAVISGRWALPQALHRRPPTDWPRRVQALYVPVFHLARGWTTLSEPAGGWPERVLPAPSGRIRADQRARRPDRPELPRHVC